MKALYFAAALFFASHAHAAGREFLDVKIVAKELSTHNYYEAGSVSENGFNGGNCIDFTLEAWRRLEARGFTNLKMLTLTSGDRSHMVLLVNDEWILSAGQNGMSIKGRSYLNTWQIVDGL